MSHAIPLKDSSMKFQIYTDAKIVGASSEGFSSHAACGGNAVLVQQALTHWLEKDVGIEIADDVEGDDG